MPNPSLYETYLEIQGLTTKHGLQGIQFFYGQELTELASSPRVNLIPTNDDFEPGMVTQMAQIDTLPNGVTGANELVKTRAPWQVLEGGDFHIYVDKSGEGIENLKKDRAKLRSIINGLILCIHDIQKARENYRLVSGKNDTATGITTKTLHYVLAVKIRSSIIDFKPAVKPNTTLVTLGSVP